MPRQIIRTSQKEWLMLLSKAYKEHSSVQLIDDADLGINPAEHTILDMGKKADLGAKDWAAVVISVGVAAAGVWMVVAAILDPEPTSKLGLLVAGGVVLAATGGLSAIKVLTQEKPPSVEFGRNGFKIDWS